MRGSIGWAGGAARSGPASAQSALADLLAEPGEPVGRLIDRPEGPEGPEVEHVWERVTDPGRLAAVRDLLAPMRAARTAREREHAARLAAARPTDLPAPTPEDRP